VQCLLLDASLKQQYAVTISNKFATVGILTQDDDDDDDVDSVQPAGTTIESDWSDFCSVIHSAASEVIGNKVPNRKPWLSDEMYQIVRQKASVQNNKPERN